MPSQEVKSIEQQIREIEEEIRKTQYNKKTQYHIGKLKAKLAQLRAELEVRSKKEKGKGYAVKKTGNATVALVGFPSVGKSTILNALTNAKSEVGAYDFTTLDVVPGIMKYEGATIQIIDLPGIIQGAHLGKGRGREVLSVARVADLIVFVIDVTQPNVEILIDELYTVGIRINKRPPDISIKRTDRGGIEVYSTVKLTKIDEEMVKTVMRENGFVNAVVVIRDDVDVDEFIDAMMGNRVYIKGMVALNKIDLIDSEGLEEVKKHIREIMGDVDIVELSAANGIGIDELKEKIFNNLDFIKIYMKPQNKPVDYSEPLIIKRNTTIEGVCNTIHRDFVKRFRYARVWGKSVKFPGQRVGLEHVVEDGDVVSLILRKEK